MAKNIPTFFGIATLCIFHTGANADPWSKLQLDLGMTFSRTEQQLKTEVGAQRGERLVEDTEVGSTLMASYQVIPWLAVGAFAHGDLGRRSAGQFAGFDESGAATLNNKSGGDYRELWMGPLLRARYKTLFAELGYGLFARRDDDARSDVPSTTGNTSDAFRTMPSVSWSFAVGGSLPIAHNLDVTARLIWRIRYYNQRGDAALADSIVHGTQSYQPFLGLSWYPGR